MPSVSAKQAKLMSAISHGWQPPAGMRAPTLAVAREFHAADKKAGKYMHAEGGKVSNLRGLFEHLRKLTDRYLGQHDPEVQHAVQTYQHAGETINNLLENRKRLYSDVNHLSDYQDEMFAHKQSLDDLIANLDKAFKEAPLMPEDAVLLRGMRPPAATKPGYLSTTTSRQVARDYADMSPGGGVYKIRVPGGTRILAPDLNPEWLDYSQREVIAPRGGKLATGEDKIVHYTPPEGYADGGEVDITDPRIQQGVMLARSRRAPSKTEHFLNLVTHAADRVTSTVTDDPHHALARVAAGLASQVAGRSPSGRVELGRLPNLVDEIKSLPAGFTDLGIGGANILGALSDKYLPQVPGGIGDALSRLRHATNAYTDKHGDPAPLASRAAEARSNAMHQAVNRAMGLSAPQGFIENASDAAGTMLGQLPIPLGEAKTGVRGAKGALAALARAVPEYLGPTIRPSVRNYLTGTLGGGALGALASPAAAAAEAPPLETGPAMKERFE